MIIELKAGKWLGDVRVIGAYINTLKEPEPKRKRSRLTKEHNYKFKDYVHR